MNPEGSFTRIIITSLLLASLPLWADQIDMNNGDSYRGQVLSLSSNILVLRSDVLGQIQIPRSQIAAVRLSNTSTPPPAPVPPAGTATAQLSTNLPPTTDPVEGVREQLLNSATPEALAKYNEMVSGLLTGRMSVNDLRAQAKNTADQVRALKRELGNDVGDSLDAYLAILDRFVAESSPTPSAQTQTNAPSASPPPSKVPQRK